MSELAQIPWEVIAGVMKGVFTAGCVFVGWLIRCGVKLLAKILTTQIAMEKNIALLCQRMDAQEKLRDDDRDEFNRWRKDKFDN